jgi:flavin-dependent dehydrogenase
MLLCGDAAGLVHPLTGEGIPYALESGLAAGEASLRGLSEGPEAARADYRERLGRRILPELLRCRRGRGLFFLDLGPLSPPLFRLAFRLRGPRFERALHWGLR